MGTERLAKLPSKLRKLLSLINQQKAQIWEALKTQPYLVLLFVAIVTYGIVFSYFTVLKHNVFQSNAWDLGIFDQSLYTTVHNGKLFYNTVELYLNSGGSYFTVHFSPILFLLLPVYAINSSPTTLLIIQSFALSLGALPLYLIAKKLLQSNKTAFMLAIAYLLYPALQGANWYDFHTAALLPVLFFSLCYFMITQRWKLYFPCVLLAVMVEEHAVFAVLIIAAYYFFASGNIKSFPKLTKPLVMDGKMASIITLLICIVYYAISIYVKSYFPIDPNYVELLKATASYSVLGLKGDPTLFPFYVISNPQNAFNALMYDYPLKFLYMIFLFGPLLFIPFKSKLTVGVIGLLALFLFSNYEAYYLIGNQYPLYVVPLIFMAAIYGLRKIDIHFRTPLLKTMLVVTLLFIISTSPISPISNTFAREGLLWYPTTSLKQNENTVSLNDLVNVIPSNASVLTQNKIFPHVSHRINAYAIPLDSTTNDTKYIRRLINSSEYVLLDLSSQEANTKFVLDEITLNNSYGLYALASNAILFKRGFQGEPMFAHYTEYRTISAYEDLFVAPVTQNVSDPSSTNGKVVLCPRDSKGYFMYGPYTYLLQGLYEATFTVKVGEHNNSRVGWCDVSSNFSRSVLAKKNIFGFELQSNEWTNFTVSFATTKLITGIEFRAFSDGIADIYIDKVTVKRISPNATSDIGVQILSSSNLSLLSGYVNDDSFLVHQQNTTSSGFWCGPYMALPAGKYRATFLLSISPSTQKTDEHVLTLSISANSGKDTYAKYEIRTSDFLNKDNVADWQEFTLEFITRDNVENVEFTGLEASSNFDIYLAYIKVEKLILSPDTNYESFSTQRGLMVEKGQIVSDSSSHSGKVALSQKGVNEGSLIYGPYIAFQNGTYTAVFRIKTDGTEQNAMVYFEVTSKQGNYINVVSQMTLNAAEINDGSWFNVTLPFSLPVFSSSIEFRVSSNGMTNLYVDTVTVLFP